MTAKTLQNIYRSANANTLAMWEDNAGIGEIRTEHYYDPVKLALATGIQPPIPFMVSRLLDELKNVTGNDPLADIQPAHGFQLLLRHNHSPLPAPFWHSTLLRYRAAFLPAKVRQFFIERQDHVFGEVAGEMSLARINYNWTTYYPVEM